MPSQISLRTSPVEVGQKSAERFAGGGEDDMKAAARTVGSLLVAHKAVRHPHSDVASVTFNGCGRNGNLPSNGASKSNGTLTAPSLQESHHHRHINGMIGLSPQPPTSIPLKTYGEASNERCSLTNDPPALTKDSSNRDLLMCPELAISYSGAMIGKRTGLLCGKQRDLEHRVSSLQRKVRLRQLSMVRAHACKQLNFQRSELSTMSVGDSSTSSFNGSDSLMADESSKPREVLPLPIQVDGASDDTFLPSHHELAKAAEEDGASDRAYGGERSRNQDSFSSLDSSYLSSVSSEAEESGARSVGAQLSALQGLLDEELTEASSDEEEGEREETADPQEQ